MDVFFTLLAPAICRAHLSSSFVFFLCVVISYLELLCICLRSIPPELASSTRTGSSATLPCPCLRAARTPCIHACSRRVELFNHPEIASLDLLAHGRSYGSITKHPIRNKSHSHWRTQTVPFLNRDRYSTIAVATPAL